MKGNKILVVDFGGQYARMIARRIRDLGVYAEVVTNDYAISKFAEEDVVGIIFSGGPASTTAKDAPMIDSEIFKIGKPILGICYGMQLIAKFLPGGDVRPSNKKEFGRAELELLDIDEKLFSAFDYFAVDNKLSVWMSHGDSVVSLPTGFKKLAITDNTPIAAFGSPELNIYGVQFHPEVDHTTGGKEFLKRFIFSICKAEKNWTLEEIIDKKIGEIRNNVPKDSNVILGLSGGVDSSVAAALIDKAIGSRLHCIFVDHGLLRYKESEQVQKYFSENFSINLHAVDAVDRFLEKLKDVTDPEAKRKIIGHEFIKVFEDKALEIDGVTHLAQGTIYSDVIESGDSKNSVTIKSHHNVGGLPDEMELKLLEPLRDLFKDEVREIGSLLGLPDELVWRQPFPGPGLGIRIIGDITAEKLNILRKADYIFREELSNSEIADKVWQSFAVLPDIKSVGVMGDERTYGYPIILRAVSSIDAMTADWVRIPGETLDLISRRIVNEVEKVNRVAYDITSKPPATIEWE